MDINDFFRNSYSSHSLEMFKLDYSGVVRRCAESQVIDFANLSKDDLVYSFNSYRNCMLREGIETDLLNDAELKTYPTRYLVKALAKICALAFNLDNCVFSTRMYTEDKPVVDDYEFDIMTYDTKLGKYVSCSSSNEVDNSRCCYMKMMVKNVEGDIAGRVTIVICFPNTNIFNFNKVSSRFVEDLINAGDRFGYNYIAHSVDDNKYSICLRISYESKMQESNFTIDRKLYHVAPMSSRDKILKRGLVPHEVNAKNGSKIAHPHRVYLFNGLDMWAIMSFLRQAKKTSKSYDRSLSKIKNSSDFALFEIDRDKISDLKLYRDNNFESKDLSNPTALYTYSNIPPSAISFKQEMHI